MKFRYQKLPIGPRDSRKPLIARPFVPVYLFGKTQSTESPYYALLDSGADRIIFPSELADAVGVDIVKGIHEPTMGIGNQKVDVYFHKLNIQVLGDSRKLTTEVGFAENVIIPILGRSFFKHSL